MNSPKISVIVFVISVGLSGLLTSCEEKADLMQRFVVKKGEHYATPRIVQSLQTNTLKFQARFDESAIYDFQEQGFQDSKNKLLGFSDCNSLHHENSARFAWQWFDNQLEIHAYCYVNGVRTEKYIGVVQVGTVNHFTLTLTDKAYIFQLNEGEPVEVERGTVCDKGVYYMLWPYFGGTLPAPHDVNVDIKMLY